MSRNHFLPFLVALLVALGGAADVIAQTSVKPSPCDWQTSVEEPADQTIQDPNALSGKLGSTRQAFESMYGLPTEDSSESFPTYEIDGCDEVAASYSPEGFLVSLDIYSPREEEQDDLWEANKADWEITSSLIVAANFLPADYESGEIAFVPQPFGYAIAKGSSQVLANQVPASAWEYGDNTPEYGYFVIVLNQNEDNDVFWIHLDLAVEDEDFPRP
jgi:hypothetical protein